MPYLTMTPADREERKAKQAACTHRNAEGGSTFIRQPTPMGFRCYREYRCSLCGKLHIDDSSD